MDVNVSDSYGYTPLIYSINGVEPNYEMAKYLLEHKADPNLITKNYSQKYNISPILELCNLSRRIDADRFKILKLLLEYGADPDIRGGGKVILF